MKKTILLFFAIFASMVSMAQVEIPYQEIDYTVHYHWGFVNVNIGHGKATISCDGSRLNATLNGNTIPWEGRVFCVSDTLNASMTPGSPLSRETVTYENGWYMKPRASAYRGGDFNPTNPSNYKNILGQGSLDADGQTMEAIKITADMLGLFYYYHEIDFPSMSPGQRITIPIAVEGGQDQSVTVTYHGQSTCEAGGTTYPTYSTTFEYTYNGAPSGYPVQAEVAVSSRIPVLLSASLPIGKVELIKE